MRFNVDSQRFHSAWVMGAADPTSGTVSVHEIIRGFGALLRTGWRPLRTILFASWDAEEVSCQAKYDAFVLIYSRISTVLLVALNGVKTSLIG